MSKAADSIKRRKQINQLLFFAFLFGALLYAGLTGVSSVKDGTKDPEIQIQEFYACQGYDSQQQPLNHQKVFQSDTESIHICGFLSPQSTILTYEGQKIYLTVDWINISSNNFLRPYWGQDQDIRAGWFYPVLKAPANGFPTGVYEVTIGTGRSMEATTTFEVVATE